MSGEELRVWDEKIEAHVAEVARLRAIEQKARAYVAALEFYADKSRYAYDNDCCPEQENPERTLGYGHGVITDCGERARAALEAK